MLGVPYKVTKVRLEMVNYSLPYVSLDRDDGNAGWLEITGPKADEMVAGHRYVITEYVEGHVNGATDTGIDSSMPRDGE